MDAVLRRPGFGSANAHERRSRISVMNVTESTQLWLADGTTVTMAAPLAGATGEGTVFAVAERPDWAAKVFHPGLTGLDAKLDKVAAMVESPPPEAMQSDGFVVLAWPQNFSPTAPIPSDS